jgi:glucose/arabinose dehydrogenase
MNRQNRLLILVSLLLSFSACSSEDSTTAMSAAGAAGTGAAPATKPTPGTAPATPGSGGAAMTPAPARGGAAGGGGPATPGAAPMAMPGDGTPTAPVPEGNTPFAIPAACGAATPNATAGNACPGTPPPAIKLTMIAGGLLAPTFAAQAPGDPSRIYVTEQQGTLRVVKDGMLSATPVLDLRDLSGAPVNNAEIIPNSYGEGGLLGMVFDPQFETTQRFWLSYTTAGPNFVVAEFKLTDPETADLASFKEMMSFQNYPFSSGAATNHVGSMLAFGPDGCMYISRGEGGGENDSHDSGQSTEDDLASILRVDVTKFPTAVEGNLAGHVWSYGFRNPWRFSFDRITGDMYIGDVGQDVGSGYEEVNVEPRGVMGRNYGWSAAAGPMGGTPEMIKPVHSYSITQTQNSVIGGYVYRGSKIAGMEGRYIWADWTERVIKTLVYKGENNGQPEACDMHDTNVTVETKVRSFAEGLDGEIYLLAGGPPSSGLAGSAAISQMGTLYRIDPM